MKYRLAKFVNFNPQTRFSFVYPSPYLLPMQLHRHEKKPHRSAKQEGGKVLVEICDLMGRHGLPVVSFFYCEGTFVTIPVLKLESTHLQNFLSGTEQSLQASNLVSVLRIWYITGCQPFPAPRTVQGARKVSELTSLVKLTFSSSATVPGGDSK
jgi:hypothetical protein